MLEEAIKNHIYRDINKFGYDEERLSDLLKELGIDKNKFDVIVQDVLSELKQFNNIVESLPKICPIEKVINYDYGSDDDWVDFIERVNYRIDLFNEEYYSNTDHLSDEYAAEIFSQRHPEICKYSVWVVANFGDIDNKYYNAFIRENNLSKKLCPQDKREQFERESDEYLKSRLLISDFREQCIIENYFLHDYIKKLSQDEFISRFNKGLYEYVKRKTLFVKKQNRSLKDNKWEKIINEILDWFVDNEINHNKIQSLFAVKSNESTIEPAKLSDDDESENIFESLGDNWMVKYKGKEKFIRHTKGMDYIALLLRDQGERLHSMKMYQIISEIAPDVDKRMSKMIESYDGLQVDGEDAYDLVDPKTIDAAKKEIIQLEAEFNQAMKENDLVRENEISIKLDKLNDYLSKCTYKGKIRTVSGATERMRQSISKAINTAKKNIKKHHKELFKHLDKFLTTGTFNSYSPDTPVSWVQNQ